MYIQLDKDAIAKFLTLTTPLQISKHQHMFVYLHKKNFLLNTPYSNHLNLALDTFALALHYVQ